LTAGGIAFSGRSGQKLAQLAGVKHEDLTAYFDMYNLIPYWPGKAGKGDAFPKEEAKQYALNIWAWEHSRVILVGSAVADVLGYKGPHCLWILFRGKWVAYVPHPSGINRFYNDKKNVATVSRFLKEAVSHVRDSRSGRPLR
jgi:uracil-DNA glycosylase